MAMLAQAHRTKAHDLVLALRADEEQARWADH